MQIRLLVPLFALVVAAQEPRIANARLDRRAPTGNLLNELRASGNGAHWVAWTVEKVPGTGNSCCYWQSGDASYYGCGLEAQNTPPAAGPRTVYLEGARRTLILVRLAAEEATKIRTMDVDCDIDAGGLAVTLLEPVTPAASVAALETFLTGDDSVARSALRAIALHAGAVADPILERATGAYLRRTVLPLVGSLRSTRGFEFLQRQPPAPEVISALGGSRDARATPLLATWITAETEPKLRAAAFSALSRQPADRAVPLLITTARQTKSLVVRKEAVRALSRSRDARALAYLREVAGP